MNRNSLFVATLAGLMASLLGCYSPRAVDAVHQHGGSIIWNDPIRPSTDIFLHGRNKRLSDDDLITMSRGLRSLRPTYLALDDQDVSDTSMESISTLTTLKGIALEGTEVTMNGIRKLKSLPHLEVVSVGAPTFTDQEIGILRNEFPSVRILKRLPSSGYWHSEGKPQTATRPERSDLLPEN